MDKRQWPRVALRIPAEVSIIIPGQRIDTVLVDSMILDMSRRGVLLDVQFLQPTHRVLLSGLRFCRIVMVDPDLPNLLVGKIVWIDQIGSEGVTRYNIGVYLEALSPHHELQLQEFVSRHLVAPAALTRQPAVHRQNN